MQKMISCLIIDIDECSEETDQCHHICNNTVGSYECSCRAGYILDSNGLSCDGEPTLKHDMSFAVFWLMANANDPHCHLFPLDINECDMGFPCGDHECVNTLGSYECRCDDGFYLSNNYCYGLCKYGHYYSQLL